MSKLDNIIKDLNKKLKNDIITTDRDAVTFRGTEEVPFLSPSLTYLFHGGFKTHTLWTIAGEFSSAKTTLSMAIAGQFQKFYKSKWETRVAELIALDKPNKNEKQELLTLQDNGYKKVLFVDVEQSANPDWGKLSKFDMDDCVYIKPQGESAEELFEIIIQLVQSDCICLVVLDSVAALSSMAQVEKSITEKTYCGVAGPMTVFTAKLMPLLTKNDCSAILINQLRSNLSSPYGGSKMPGGKALGFNSHVILNTRRAKAIDEAYKEIPNSSDSYYGQYINIHVDKNKITKPDRRLTTASVVFDKGQYALLDTFNLAITFGIIQKAGAWFQYSSDGTNPDTDSDGVTMKWQGQVNAIKYMESHEEFYTKVRELVEEKCK